MKRRDFLKLSAMASGALLASKVLNAYSSSQPLMPAPPPPASPTRIAFVKTRDRAEGIKKAIELLELNTIKGKNLFLKPNFNSADEAPGSTHDETLSTLVRQLQNIGADRITVGDRSGMGDTRAVMEQKDTFRMAEELNFSTLIFDDLTAEDWIPQHLPNSYWKQGFAVPRPVLEADGIIQTCCLKTHRYGGHFTLSLKNSVGLAAKWVPGEGYNYMQELHNSPHQRHMIAEINAAYRPDLILLDGIDAFVDGGPARGTQVESNVILAGTDRIAIDAVGVALLRHFGTTSAVSTGPVFEQEQIARAVELGLGITGPGLIEFVTDTAESAAYAQQIEEILYL